MGTRRRPVPPEAEAIRLATEIRSLQPQIDEANERIVALYDSRALLIKELWNRGLRYIDLQPLLGMNGGAIFGALKRADALVHKQALARAADLVNDRTNDPGA